VSTGAGVHAVAPVAAENVPAAQGVAEVAPEPATNEPAGAGVQGVLPVALKVPGVHGTGIGMHAVCPVSPLV
jgi:hypothetical protein